MLLLVALVEGVLGVASEHVSLGAHGVRIAGKAGIFPPPTWLAVGGWLILDQQNIIPPLVLLLNNVQKLQNESESQY